VPVTKPVSVDLDDGTLREAFRRVLGGTGLEVLVQAGDYLVLVKAPSDPAQGGTVTGRVTDAKSGQPIVGASVVLDGTRWHATTSENGAYRLAEVKPGTYTLTASRIGYAKQSQSVTVVAGQEATVDVHVELSASPLDAVVVTGTLVPTEVKALPTPISVVTAQDIQQQNIQRLDQIFRGQLPGAVAWDTGPFENNSTIAAVRGASSLASTPTIKTFIDGVEVADPGFIATIDPNSIDRIEVTRGPQASTLYGAGALNGVMQIFTKKGVLGRTRPEVTAKLSAGSVGGYDGSGSAFQTDNAVSVLGGGENASYSFGGSYRHIGEWVPSYISRDWGLWAGGQTTQGPLTFSASLRYVDKTLDYPWDTRLQSYPPWSKPFYTTYPVRQQTYGMTVSYQATPNWQHTLTLGYDQTYNSGVQTQPRFRTPGDSLLSVTATHQAKTSLLYHTDVSLRLGPVVGAVATAGANYNAYDDLFISTSGTAQTTGFLSGSTLILRTPWTNTGYFAQVQLNLAERLFLTSGLRAERNQNFGADFGTAWSPRVGAAYVLGVGSATVKLRASYGESLRPPNPAQSVGLVTPFSVTLANPNLAPERQRGFDGGVEIFAGRASLGVTYYNQRAIDLIQRLAVSPPPGDTLPTDQYQNISRVKNEGWELEGHLPLGPAQVAATYSIMNSTVQVLPPGYPTGQYQVGDPILGIPHTSGGMTVTYTPLPRTTLTASMTYIGHWTQMDILSFYAFVFGGQPYRGSMRAYWIEYPSVTKVALGVSRVLRPGLTAFVRAENVGNSLRAEQVNVQVPMPRSVVAGANVQY